MTDLPQTPWEILAAIPPACGEFDPLGNGTQCHLEPDHAGKHRSSTSIAISKTKVFTYIEWED